MVVFYVLGGILLSVAGVFGWLFYSLKKSSAGSVEASAVPITNIEELKSFAAIRPVTSTGSAITPILPAAVGEADREKSDKDFPALQGNPGILPASSCTSVSDVICDLDAKSGFNSAISQLRAENEGLRADIARLGQVNPPLNDEELSHLKAESSAFRMQMTAGNLEVARLSDIIARLEGENARLQAEKVSADSFQNAQAVEPVKEDAAAPALDRARLEARVEELEEAVRVDKEKNDFLVYELTKSRAHAVGVERICDNARLQFDGLAREARDTCQDNALLKKQSNVLEQSLSDFKRLNSELLKQEKLTQFELEHNRTQLKELEHIYQVFRSRLQSAGVSVEASATKS